MNLEQINEKINIFIDDFNNLRYTVDCVFSYDDFNDLTKCLFHSKIIEKKKENYFLILNFYEDNCFYIENELLEKTNDIEVLFVYLEKSLNKKGFYRKRNLILETKFNIKNNFILF
jgi:uncharacterized Fe-S cluster-containing protein